MKNMDAEKNAGKLWVLLGLLAFCLIAALPLFASPVAEAADDGIELRDMYNRPVSRAALGREFRAGQRALLREASLSSRAEGRLLDLLERGGVLDSALRVPHTPAPARDASSALAPLREPRVQAVVPPAPTVLPVRAARAEPSLSAFRSPDARLSLPLRC
ncbi:MAG: hypothetical protein WC969_12195 [Elusimicrobiota bacterium]|jgi:hypothetical protein